MILKKVTISSTFFFDSAAQEGRNRMKKMPVKSFYEERLLLMQCRLQSVI